jgi:hypothetical protein
VHIEGSNSALFQVLGLLHPRIRTAMLIRELLNKRRAHVAVRIGNAIPIEKLLAVPTDDERVEYLRWRTYLLASRNDYRVNTFLPLTRRRRRSSFKDPVAPAVAPSLLAREVAALPPAALLSRSGDLSAYAARADEVPNVLTEIGRLREITFRAVGEGTGSAYDLDGFDQHYLHPLSGIKQDRK